MIAAANPDAADDIWPNHQSIHDHIMSEYNRHEGIVVEHLARAISNGRLLDYLLPLHTSTAWEAFWVELF